MAETVSPAAGGRYGVARVCRVWGVPRSSFYAVRAGATRPPVAPARRGPKPTISDADLLAAIRADLTRSPWSGEGHRKVWARLRVLEQIVTDGGAQTANQIEALREQARIPLEDKTP